MKKFFKVLGIFVFIIIVFAVIALFAGFIFLKTVDIKKYKPQIIAAASDALGRAVDFKDVSFSVSLQQGAKFSMRGLTIAENPSFGAENFVSVEEIDAGVDLLAFLTSRKILVPAVLVHSPRISIVRDPAGFFNFQTFKGKSDVSAPQTFSASTAAIPAIFVGSFKIENAQIVFTDQSVAPELKLNISQLTFESKNFSLLQPFDLSIEAAVLSAEKNLNVSANLQLDLAESWLKLSSADAAFNFDPIPAGKLKFLSTLGLPVPQLLNGQLKFKAHGAEFSSAGLTKINADVFFYNGRILVEDISSGVSLEARRMEISLENFSLGSFGDTKLGVKAALYQDETNVDFHARIAFDQAKKEIRVVDGGVVTNLNLWPLKKIQAQVAPLKDLPLPESLSGKVEITVKEALISSSGLQAVLLDAKWLGGAVLMKDVMPSASIALTKTDLEIGNFSFGKQFAVSFKTSYLSQMQNVSFSGAVAYDPNTREVLIKNGIAQFNANGFDLEAFKTSGFIAKDIVFPQTLAGVFEAQINDLTASPKGLGEMNVDLKWQNGKIVLNDFAPGMSLLANQINVALVDFSLLKPFLVNVSLGYEADEDNLSLNGKVLLDLAGQKVNLTDATFKTDFSKLPLEQIKSKITALKDISLPERLKGSSNIAIANATIGSTGVLALMADVALSGLEVKLKELALPIRAESINLKVTEGQLTSDEFTLYLGKGQIISKIDVLDYMNLRDFSASGEIKGLDLAQILSQDKAAVKIDGLAFGNFKVKGQATDLNTLVGDGSFEVKEMKVRDFNLMKTVLDKISFIPDVVSRIEAKLPENYKTKLAGKDTLIDKVAGRFTLTGGKILLDPIDVGAEEFVFDGKCTAAFDQSYSLDGAFKITHELSGWMGESLEEITYLYDADRNVSLPVHISGRGAEMPNVAVLQSAVDIGKNAARNEAQKQLGKILEKTLGSSGDSPNPPADGVPAGQEPSTGEKIIGGILDKVFK